MADITIVAADIRPLPGCKIRRFTAASAIPVGAAVYLSAADTIATATGADVAHATVIGVLVAVHNGASAAAAAAGEACDVVMLGPVAGYTSVVFGTYYFVTDVAGVISDTAGTIHTLVGIGLSASVLLVRPQPVTFA